MANAIINGLKNYNYIDVDQFREIVVSNLDIINQKYEVEESDETWMSSKTALMIACQKNLFKHIDILLDCNANPNIEDKYGNNALNWCRVDPNKYDSPFELQYEIFTKLMKYGAEIDKEGKSLIELYQTAVTTEQIELCNQISINNFEKIVLDYSKLFNCFNRNPKAAIELFKRFPIEDMLAKTKTLVEFQSISIPKNYKETINTLNRIPTLLSIIAKPYAYILKDNYINGIKTLIDKNNKTINQEIHSTLEKLVLNPEFKDDYEELFIYSSKYQLDKQIPNSRKQTKIKV